jgi:hypothetical protein
MTTVKSLITLVYLELASEKHSSLLCKSVDYTKKGFILLSPKKSFLSSNEYDLNRGGNSQKLLTLILRLKSYYWYLNTNS